MTICGLIIATGLLEISCSEHGRHNRSAFSGPELRGALPDGSSLDTVQDYLKRRQIEYSFDPGSKTIFAIKRNTNANSSIIRENLAITFYFNDALALTRLTQRRSTPALKQT